MQQPSSAGSPTSHPQSSSSLYASSICSRTPPFHHAFTQTHPSLPVLQHSSLTLHHPQCPWCEANSPERRLTSTSHPLIQPASSPRLILTKRSPSALQIHFDYLIPPLHVFLKHLLYRSPLLPPSTPLPSLSPSSPMPVPRDHPPQQALLARHAPPDQLHSVNYVVPPWSEPSRFRLLALNAISASQGHQQRFSSLPSMPYSTYSDYDYHL